MNTVILTGRLGKDPEKLTTSGGKLLAKFSVAENVNKNDTQWHNVECWEKQAEIAQKYLKKGSQIVIQGRIKYEEHEGKRYTKIIANSFEMMGGKQESNDEENLPF